MLKDKPKVQFFYIIGRARSGTTMLRSLFDAHPNVIIPTESPVIIRLFNKYGKIKSWDQQTITDLFNDLVKFQYFNYWNVDEQKLLEDLLKLNSNSSFDEIIKCIYLHYSSVFEKKEILAIGDKYPVYSVKIRQIYGIIPDAKYIVLARDYRDHVLSMQKAKILLPGVLFITYRWRYAFSRILKVMKKHPAQFFLIRYEDLVENPQFHLEKLCHFIGIEFDPSVLKYPEKKEEIEAIYPKELIDNLFKYLFEPITPRSVGKWKKEMTEKQIKIADTVAGKYAGILGYEKKYSFPGFWLYLEIKSGMCFQAFLYAFRRAFSKLPFALKKVLRKIIPFSDYIFLSKQE